MATAELEKLRNVGLLGQGGSGKTSLGEAMLFAAGVTQRLGKVQDGTSVLDHEPEEIKHYVSISPFSADRYAGLRRFPGGFDQLHARFRRCCICA
jgi:translation elongation factor EF-G